MGTLGIIGETTKIGNFNPSVRALIDKNVENAYDR